jgi:hypothetical protein
MFYLFKYQLLSLLYVNMIDEEYCNHGEILRYNFLISKI